MPRNRPQPAKLLIVTSGESIKSVAEAIGMGDHSLYGALNGHTRPWPALTAKLAEYLEVDGSELWLDDSTLADAARQLAATTRRSQGLPASVTDVAVLEKVATLVAASARSEAVQR